MKKRQLVSHAAIFRSWILNGGIHILILGSKAIIVNWQVLYIFCFLYHSYILVLIIAARFCLRLAGYQYSSPINRYKSLILDFKVWKYTRYVNRVVLPVVFTVCFFELLGKTGGMLPFFFRRHSSLSRSRQQRGSVFVRSMNSWRQLLELWAVFDLEQLCYLLF